MSYSRFGKRLFDILSSCCVLIFISPFFLAIAIAIKFTSSGPVFYLQKRVGLHGRLFSLYKFRTMRVNADKQGPLITVGMRDQRITSIGHHLRRFKLDELPQLINILKGEMSVVGPRPEVEKYVAFYNEIQKKVLSVRPGLTDYASIMYVRENEILAQAAEPEKAYIEEIMQKKLELALVYVKEVSFSTDIKIILKTLCSILR